MFFALMGSLAAGGAIALVAVALVRQAMNRPQDRRIQRLVERPRLVHRGLSTDEVMRRRAANIPGLRKFVEKGRWAERWEVDLEQAGIRMRVGEYLLIRVALGFAVLVFVTAVGRSALGFVVGLALGAVAYWLPSYVLHLLRRRRAQQVAKQLPEAVTMMANALRAGFAFQHGMDMVAKEFEPPIAEEFQRATTDIAVGASVEEALHGMMARADSEDMNLIVTAVLIQRSSGGNLAEILENVAETMRERERLEGEVRTMTSQQRFSGTVLTFWPLLLLLLFCALNWHHTSVLFTTFAGRIMLAAGGIGQLLGFFTIRRILDVDI
ncbi:MAG TPA: type II secretion system F family protein [Dehalococcoidia bacterium]|jgi:tight adherence protein B|nr:type II secretion system F family protein [Dehalococcoidia bacterium]